MKKLHLLGLALCFLFVSFSANAQFEVKINPIGALFQSPDVSVEYIVNDDFGVEGKLGFAWSNNDVLGSEVRSNGLSLAVLGKYYFGPQEGADRFYTGMYGKFRTNNSSSNDVGVLSYNNTRLALGVVFGYKWVGDNGIVLDINLGLGRALVNNFKFDDPNDEIYEDALSLGNFDAISTIALGYRFPGK